MGVAADIVVAVVTGLGSLALVVIVQRVLAWAIDRARAHGRQRRAQGHGRVIG